DYGENLAGRNPPTGSDQALDLVDFALFPHLDHERFPENSLANLERWAAGVHVPAYLIDDQTAIKVVDGAVDVISEGHWKLVTPEYAGAALSRQCSSLVELIVPRPPSRPPTSRDLDSNLGEVSVDLQTLGTPELELLEEIVERSSDNAR